MASQNCKRYIITDCFGGNPPVQTDDELIALDFDAGGEHFVIDTHTGTFFDNEASEPWTPMKEATL